MFELYTRNCARFSAGRRKLVVSEVCRLCNAEAPPGVCVLSCPERNRKAFGQLAGTTNQANNIGCAGLEGCDVRCITYLGSSPTG